MFNVLLHQVTCLKNNETVGGLFLWLTLDLFGFILSFLPQSSVEKLRMVNKWFYDRVSQVSRRGLGRCQSCGFRHSPHLQFMFHRGRFRSSSEEEGLSFEDFLELDKETRLRIRSLQQHASNTGERFAMYTAFATLAGMLSYYSFLTVIS